MGHGLLRRLGAGEQVLAVDPQGGQPQAGRHRGEFGDGKHVLRRGELQHAVVLAPEDHRQLVGLGHVQGFVGAALLVGTVARAGDGHLVRALVACRQAPAHGRREVGADVARQAEDVVLRKAGVDAGAALAAARHAPHVFGDVAVQVDALGQHVGGGVGTVMRPHRVVLAQIGAGGHARGQRDAAFVIEADHAAGADHAHHHLVDGDGACQQAIEPDLFLGVHGGGRHCRTPGLKPRTRFGG